ncbi:MAG TPA: protein kinase, partial [Gemmatimonadaceae bacterium]
MSLPAQELSPGSSFGAYRINKLLGRGGMGAVYEAVHEDDGRVVALKLLSVELDNMDSRQRFLREGRTAAAINHPNAVYIYGTEEIDGVPVISMELVPGGTLEEKVQERGPLPVAEAVEDILQVIDGLDAALSAGVLHRDVKPANCFVNASGVVKIGDFGLSKPVDSADQQKLTQTGVFLGTPVFSSPEQLLGEKLDARSDIYAVGVTFYYLLTGQLPYQSGSMMQVIAAVLNGSPAPLTSHRADLPQPVVDVVMKAIARKPGDRYQSYHEFRAAVLALRKPETSPATVWDRIRAAVVDGLVIAIISWILFQLTMAVTGKGWTSTMPQGMKLNFVLGGIVALLIVGVPEGLRGMSIGKWLLGIRVANLDGQVAGLPRALSRALILQVINFVALMAQLNGSNQNAKATLALVTSVGLRALLLITVRRSNGNMMLHDWLTGTRVIKRLAGAQKRHGEAQRRAAPALSGTERRIGPYAVLGPLNEGGSVLIGWDASMHRSVWIVPQDDGAAEVPQARRDLARLTRLRWVAGRRSAGENWDAYESPLGESLSTRLERAVPWNVLQEWMLDLTGELLAAQGDGTMPAALGEESLWVTSGERIVVLESASRTGERAGDAEQSLACVQSVLGLIRAAAHGSAPLPRYASRAISAAKDARSVDEIHEIFKATLGRPVSISRVRRSGLVAA